MAPVPSESDPSSLDAHRPVQRTAESSLLALLDDPSPSTWEPVFRALRARGPAALPALRAAAKADNPRLRARARALVEGHERRRRMRRLIAYASRTSGPPSQRAGERFELERAMWLFSGLETDRFDARAYVRTLDLLAESALAHFAKRKIGAGPLERAMALPDFMGRRFRFEAPRSSPHDEEPESDEFHRATHHPHEIFLHRVLEKRRGLPLSIAIVWQLVAARLGAPMELIGIPGHVLVRVPGAAAGGGRRILVDPASGGRPVSRREVRQYLEAYDVPFGPGIFAPMSPRGIVRRQIANLMRGLGLRGQLGQAEELLTLHALLED